MKNRRLIAAVLAFIFMSLMVGNYDIQAVGTFKSLPPIQGVNANHEFKIRLSRELDETSLVDGAVRIYEKDTLKPIDIIVRRDTYDAKLIKVKGKSDFEIGKTYTLEVRNLKSKKDEYFKQAYRVDFTVKSAYAGLPAEAGLIIVENKAYAIDYLKKNVWMVNEIISSNYEVYYFYDVNYQKIRSLFNIGPVNSSTVNINREPITYIDKDGNKHLYIWRDDRQEYELAMPKAYVDVISRSDAKAVSIKVSQVSSVPDAMYYSIKGSNLIKNFNDPLAYIAVENTEEISILSHDKSVIAKGIVGVDKNYSGEVIFRLVDSLNSGNSAGNINNNGIAAGYTDGYIYYVNNADKEKLYKQSLGGIFNRVISEDKAQYVNESGDWIYFSNYTDGGKLYKIKKDGTLKQKMLEDKAAYITISGQDIYYSNHSDGGKLYRVKKDLSDAKIGSDGLKRGNPVVVNYGNYNGATDEVAYINIVGDWIYYTNYSDGHKPYVIHKEGSFRGKLSDSFADSLQVYGDWIYFTSDSGTISKINKSIGSSVVPIKATTAEFNKGHHINVYGDWIFYSNAEDAGKLYKINTDGSGNKIKLSDESVGYMNVVGNWIYFTTVKGKLFRLPVSSNGDISAEEVTLNKDPNKVVEIQDVYVTVDYADVDKPFSWLENKYLPQKVAATMADNTMQQLVIAWDTNPKNVADKDGVRTYKGTVVGFNMTINLIMTIPSQMLNDTNTIKVYKNGNKNDMVIVEGSNNNVLRARISEGDVITVWDKSDRLQGTSIVGKDGRAVVSKLDLNSYGDSIFIRVKRGKKAPSNPTEVRLYNVPVVRSVNVMDNDAVGLGVDTRDIKIREWSQAYFDNYKPNILDAYYSLKLQEVYALPTKAVLDMTKHIPLDTVQMKRGTTAIIDWDGSVLGNSNGVYPNKDSAGSVLKGGLYDVYISNTFTGIGSADISGYRPQVEGKIANSAAATFTMIGEGIPVKPTIKIQKVQGSGMNLPNDKVVLDKTLLPNETAWLVPVSIIDKYNLRGWRAESGSNPFEALVGIEDVKFYSGTGTVMEAPTGDRSASPQDVQYKLFVVNEIGASPESDNKIIVDNKKPDVKPVVDPSKPGVYYVGDPINVMSDEKSKVYVVNDKVLLTAEALEQSLKNLNSLMAAHTGNNIKVSLYKSETLIDFTIAGTTTPAMPYYVVGVDEAGNISNPYPISIQRDFEEFNKVYYPALDFATATNPAPKDLLATLAKAKAILEKATVKQTEIDLITKELQSKMGMANSELTLSTNDPANIKFEGKTIKVPQMTLSQLKSKLITRQGIQPTIVNSDNSSTMGTDYATDGMKVLVTDGTDNLEYILYVYTAINLSTADELMYAINVNKNIDAITLTPGSFSLYDKDGVVSITRKLSIQGSAGGNSEIRFESGARIENSGELSISKVTFAGIEERDSDVIINTNSLTMDNVKFSNFNFISNDKAVVRSLDGAKLVLIKSIFSSIKSESNSFSHVFVSSNTHADTRIEENIFNGQQTGRSVKGIMFGGNAVSGGQILIKKNTFNGFISKDKNTMSTPIYINGGYVSLTTNSITNSDSGIFIDVAARPVQVDTESLSTSVDNFKDGGALLLSKNRGVTGNYFGDIMIGRTIPGQVPYIYYNSTATPIIMGLTIDQNTRKLTINDEPINGNRFMIKQSSMISAALPPKVGYVIKPADGYADFNENITIDREKYLTIIEVDAGNKVVKYRQTYIP